MSRRTEVLTAVKALIQRTRPQAVVRGMDNTDAKPDEIGPEGEAIVRAGDPGDPAIDLSPPIYNWDHTIPVELRAHGAGGMTAQQILDQWLMTIGAAIEGDRTLGGRCTYLDAGAPMEGESDAFGAMPVGWADFTILASYQTSGPLA